MHIEEHSLWGMLCIGLTGACLHVNTQGFLFVLVVVVCLLLSHRDDEESTTFQKPQSVSARQGGMENEERETTKNPRKMIQSMSERTPKQATVIINPVSC